MLSLQTYNIRVRCEAEQVEAVKVAIEKALGTGKETDAAGKTTP